MPKLKKRDVDMMRLTCQMELSLVAERLSMSRTAIHSRYEWLREKRVECQIFINTLNALERACPKLRKLLTPNMKAKDNLKSDEDE